MHNTVTIYTDGSCHNKTGIGGVGVYMIYGEHELRFNKGYEGTTSARMEIQAVIHAMQLITNKKCKLHIYCDNEYVVKSLREKWVFNWEQHGYSGKKNSDLWKKFLYEYRLFSNDAITIEWVRGHNKGQCPGNEEADRLAGEAYQQMKNS